MKKLLILGCALLPVAGWAQSQDNASEFNFEVGYSHSFGLHQSGFYHTDQTKYGNSWRVAALYNITPQLSAGAGFEIGALENPSCNRMAPYATIRYKPFEGSGKDLYLYGNLGWAIGTDDKHNRFYPGFTGEAGLGYTKMFAKHFGVYIHAGYGFNQMRYTATGINTDGSIAFNEKVHDNRGSLVVSVGIVF